LSFINGRWIHKSEERHLVVPLAAELFLYCAFFSNEIEKIWWLTGRSTLRFCSLGFFVPEKRFPRRLVVTLVFRCLIPSGKETNRKRWVDREVNIAEKTKRKSWLTRRSTLRFCPSGFVIWKNDILSFIIVHRIHKSEKRCPRCSMGTQVFFLDWHLGCVSHNSCFQAGIIIIYSTTHYAGKYLYSLLYSYFYYKFHSFQSHIISLPQTVN